MDTENEQNDRVSEEVEIVIHADTDSQRPDPGREEEEADEDYAEDHGENEIEEEQEEESELEVRNESPAEEDEEVNEVRDEDDVSGKGEVDVEEASDCYVPEDRARDDDNQFEKQPNTTRHQNGDHVKDQVNNEDDLYSRKSLLFCVVFSVRTVVCYVLPITGGQLFTCKCPLDKF